MLLEIGVLLAIAVTEVHHPSLDPYVLGTVLMLSLSATRRRPTATPAAAATVVALALAPLSTMILVPMVPSTMGAPFVEELVFRLALMGIPAAPLSVLTVADRGLRPGRGTRILVAVSAFAFALSHVPAWGPWKFPQALATGLVFALTFAAFGFPEAVAVHAAVNSISALARVSPALGAAWTGAIILLGAREIALNPQVRRLLDVVRETEEPRSSKVALRARGPGEADRAEGGDPGEGNNDLGAHERGSEDMGGAGPLGPGGGGGG